VKHLRILLVLITLLMGVSSATQAGIEIDTTKVRRPEPPRKPLGYKLLYVPSKVLQLPFDILEVTTRGLVYISYDSPFGQRLMRNVLNPTRPIHPVFGSGGNGGFGGGLGIRLNSLISKHDRLSVRGTYSVFDYSHIGLTHTVPLDSSFTLTTTVTYDRMEREPFYGFGNNSLDRDEVAFTHERIVAGTELDWAVSRRFHAGVAVAYNAHNTFDGDDPDLQGALDSIQTALALVPTDLRSTRYVSTELGLYYDYRNNPGQPSSGGFGKITGTFYGGVGRSDELRFYKLRLDYRHFIELFEKRVFRVRLLAQSIDIIDVENRPRNPIYLQSYLGGPDGLQGYEPSRFTDKEMALVSIEYRWPVWRAIDGVLFFEEGRVFDSFSDSFTFRHWQYSVGTGLRVWSRWGQVASLTIAWSREETRFVFNFGTDLVP
jgi:outer membrane protein assembly factor BamA